MKLCQIKRWIFPLCILLSVGKVPAATNDPDDLEVQVLQETLAAGRGHRDKQGVRDQWDSKAHLNEKFDVYKKPISQKVRTLLKSYRLDCKGCDEQEAVAKINAFVKETKQQAEQQARRQLWLERAAALATILILGGTAYLYANGMLESVGKNGFSLGSGGASGMASGRRLEIEEQRRRAAKRKEEATLQVKEPPNWRENEEMEVWTPKQEKQFAKALVAFGGVPPKGRYTLIADKVDGKTRQECLMHHKLLQLIEKEEQYQATGG